MSKYLFPRIVVFQLWLPYPYMYVATNMAPHNLTEVVDGILAYIDNNDIEIEFC